MSQEKYYFGTGRRKTCIAQVRIFKGTGKYIYTKDEKKTPLGEDIIEKISRPFEILSLEGKFDTSVMLSGGGRSAANNAISLAIARALCKIDETYEKTLKKEGLLTRDSREKERKKPGLKRARRAPQWQKR